MKIKSLRSVQNTPHETQMDLDSSMAMFSRFARSLGGFGGLSAPLFVFMEGNVGAGKSTVLAELKFALEAKGKRVCLFLEQSERWSHQGLLRDAYDGSTSGKRAFEVLGPLRDFVDRRRFLNAHEREYDVVLFERHPVDGSARVRRRFGSGDARDVRERRRGLSFRESPGDDDLSESVSGRMLATRGRERSAGREEDHERFFARKTRGARERDET